MARFRVFASNRLEILLEYLAEVLGEPLVSPLDQERIVVQSKGMERWVSMRLAQRFGVWGNCCYPFPNAIIYELIPLVLPGAPDGTPFDPKILAWRIMKHLSGCALRPGFESLRTYLGQKADPGQNPDLAQKADELKRLQLSAHLANIFDRYTMFRPEWVLDWEKGPNSGSQESHWQAQLWRELVAETNGSHKAAILKRFIDRVDKAPDRVDKPPIDQGKLPVRLSIFGIPALPPMHLNIFTAISRHVEVNLFLMNPCQEYWFDLVSEKETAKKVSGENLPGRKSISTGKNTGESLSLGQSIPGQSLTGQSIHGRQTIPIRKIISPEDLHLETGHPLLASLGKMGAHFFDTLLDVPFIEEEKRFEDPGQGTLLACLQSDILNLRNRGGSGSGDWEKKIIAPDDDSIRVHVCHSPMREIEVLYDHLLDLFEREPDLEPGDIMVMMPDIESYAPYIGAVFEDCQHPRQKIPYSIADRSVRREGHVIEVFLKILGLYGSRFGQTQVLDILEAPPVQRRFGLEGEGVECVRRWVEDTRIRWGMDAKDRSRTGVPEFEENTWKAGLDRLLLGYAMPGREERMFADILPYDHIEGSEAAVLGRFIDFIHRLFDQVAGLEQPRTLAGWAAVLRNILDQFFDGSEQAHLGQAHPEQAHPEQAHLEQAHLEQAHLEQAQMEVVQRLLNDLRDTQEAAGFEEKVEIGLVRTYITDRLNQEELGTGFLTGGVTFCTMLPMRSIPFRVVALVGMSDGAFPRLSRPLGFDLIAKSPRRGDPSKRDEDRYLFLEALLCARGHLSISYVGQSIRDNSRIPPSVVVSELLDVIERGFEHPQKKILGHVITHHRLQSFSPAYFQPAGVPETGVPETGVPETDTHETDAPVYGPLFSYSKENYQALCARREAFHALCTGQETQSRPFVIEPLPEMPADRKSIEVDQLIRFLVNPARFFLIHRLGIRLEDLAAPLEEREPFEIEGLDRYQIEQTLVKKLVKNKLQVVSLEHAHLGQTHLDDHYPLVRAKGILPPGTMGEMAYREIYAQVNGFMARVLHHAQGEEMPPLEVNLNLTGFRLTGRIEGIWPGGLLRYRCAKIKAGDLLSIWVEHLVINCLKESGYPIPGTPAASTIIGRDSPGSAEWRFDCVPDSREILEQILELFWRGMHTPLPFFPKTSLEYTKRILESGDVQEALNRAKVYWKGNDYEQGESENPYLQLCFGKVDDPLNGDFQTLGRDIFEPLLNYRQQCLDR